MAVAHTPKGYAGTVTEVDEARRFGLSSTRFRVASAADWKVTANTTLTRTVQIDPGSAVACGVYDTTTAQDQVTFAANSSGSTRLDALVATFTWGTGTVTFQVIQGTTSVPVGNTTTTVDNTKINRIPGVRYDAVLAIVKVRSGVGAFVSSDVVDTRVWAGTSGPLCIQQGANLSSADLPPGTDVRAMDTDVVYSYTGTQIQVARWVGTDRTRQPMISLNWTNANVPHNSPLTFQNWTTVVDHGLGLLTYGANQYIQINYGGRVRIDWQVSSDSTVLGTSHVSVALPYGGGSVFTVSEDQAQRQVGYSAAGVLIQSRSVGPVFMQPGDQISLTLQQISADASARTYQAYLQVTYV